MNPKMVTCYFTVSIRAITVQHTAILQQIHGDEPSWRERLPNRLHLMRQQTRANRPYWQIPFHMLPQIVWLPGVGGGRAAEGGIQSGPLFPPQEAARGPAEGQKWPMRVVKRLREHCAEEATLRPKLEEGHLMMNWEVTGSRYLHRRRWGRGTGGWMGDHRRMQD